MNLDKKRPLVRYYFWALPVINRFLGRNHYSCREKSDLCEFIRVTCLWLPLIVVVELGVLILGVFTIAVLPFILFGFAYPKSVLGMIIIVAVAYFALTLLFYLYIGAQAVISAVAGRPEKKADEDRQPGLLKIFLFWLQARKGKYCKEITFTDSSQGGN